MLGRCGNYRKRVNDGRNGLRFNLAIVSDPSIGYLGFELGEEAILGRLLRNWICEFSPVL